MTEREDLEVVQEEEEEIADPRTWKKEDASNAGREDTWRDIAPSSREEEEIQDHHHQEEIEETSPEEMAEKLAIAHPDQEAEEAADEEAKEATLLTLKSDSWVPNSNNEPKIKAKTSTLVSCLLPSMTIDA